jgi:hypothetical protein
MTKAATSQEMRNCFVMLKNKSSPPVAERKAIIEKHLFGHFGATAMFKSIWNMGFYWFT